MSWWARAEPTGKTKAGAFAGPINSISAQTGRPTPPAPAMATMAPATATTSTTNPTRPATATATCRCSRPSHPRRRRHPRRSRPTSRCCRTRRGGSARRRRPWRGPRCAQTPRTTGRGGAGRRSTFVRVFEWSLLLCGGVGVGGGGGVRGRCLDARRLESSAKSTGCHPLPLLLFPSPFFCLHLTSACCCTRLRGSCRGTVVVFVGGGGGGGVVIGRYGRAGCERSRRPTQPRLHTAVPPSSAAQRSAAQRTVSVTLTTTEPGLHAPSRSSFSPYLGGGAVHCVCAFERGCVG